MSAKTIIEPCNAIDVHVELSKKAQLFFKPLQKLGVTQFTYSRSFNDLTQFNISSNPIWLENYYSSGLHKIGSFNGNPKLYHSGIVLWEEINNDQIFNHSRIHFNVGQGLTIIEKYKDGCEFYFFGGAVDNPKVLGVFLNNLWLFKQYINYFKHENKRFITQATYSRMPLHVHGDVENQRIHDIFTNMHALDEDEKRIFMLDTKPTLLRLNIGGDEIELTKSECKCVKLMLQGKTADESAKKLFLSRRTIEKHLNNIREKLHCRNKIEVAALLGLHCDFLLKS